MAAPDSLQPEAFGDHLRLVGATALSASAFALLGAIQLELAVDEFGNTLQHPGVGTVSFLLSRILTLAIPTAIAFLYVMRRPRPQASGRRTTTLVGVYASFVLLSIRPIELFLGVSTPSPGLAASLAANALTILGGIVALSGLASLRAASASRRRPGVCAPAAPTGSCATRYTRARS